MFRREICDLLSLITATVILEAALLEYCSGLWHVVLTAL